MENCFFPIPLFISFFNKNGPVRFWIDRFCQCSHFGLCIFWEIYFSKQNLLGCWILRFVYWCVVEIDVKSFPFEEWMVNLASWTPSNFGRYPKSPKWSSQSRPMTDFVRKSRPVKPHHASLFLSLINAIIVVKCFIARQRKIIKLMWLSIRWVDLFRKHIKAIRNGWEHLT